MARHFGHCRVCLANENWLPAEPDASRPTCTVALYKIYNAGQKNPASLVCQVASCWPQQVNMRIAMIPWPIAHSQSNPRVKSSRSCLLWTHSTDCTPLSVFKWPHGIWNPGQVPSFIDSKASIFALCAAQILWRAQKSSGVMKPQLVEIHLNLEYWALKGLEVLLIIPSHKYRRAANIQLQRLPASPFIYLGRAQMTSTKESQCAHLCKFYVYCPYQKGSINMKRHLCHEL